ncbi:hypothetical protein SAMD00019534_039040, partial [Acytostelium subglobosum LB1]|uniref:hypothetical protein n=1 Tax=Acytostelium subglobosum LB1 TaxID=1410327 RepID=UPI0006449340
YLQMSSLAVDISTTNCNNIPNIDHDKYKQFLTNPKFHMAGWMWAHMCVYRLFEMADTRLSTWHPKSKSEITSVLRALRAISNLLNDHHDHEDQDVWPELIAFDTATKEHLDFLDKQHAQWHHLSTELGALMTNLEQYDHVDEETRPAIQATCQQLSAKFKETRECVVLHFNDEERLLMPIVLTMSKKEQDKITKAIMERGKKEGKAAGTDKFVFCAFYDTSLHYKVMGDSLNKEVPWLVRKIVSIFLMKKEYQWFIDALEVK